VGEERKKMGLEEGSEERKKEMKLRRGNEIRGGAERWNWGKNGG
jgi:hypothetical protein